MGPFQIILLVALTLLKFSEGDAAFCETDWVTFRDELCIRIFPDELTYDEAKEFCTSNANETSRASLVLVKEPDMQSFLANYTQTFQATNLWLGGKYDGSTGQFRWEDGEPLTYINWAEGYPRNVTDSETCIELRPTNDNSLARRIDGNWRNDDCQNQKRVMCQRPISWTLEDAVKELIKNRNELQQQLEAIRTELNATRNEMQAQTGNSNFVPIGFIYIEYFNQSSPGTIWPNCTWQDISNTYKGLFFRADGGNSGSWGEIQAGCAPRIGRVEYVRRDFCEGPYSNPVNFPSSGFSDYIHAGWYQKDGGRNYRGEGLRFRTDTCEIRPSNQAIRIWKRTA